MEAVIDQAGEQTNPVVQNRSGGVGNSEKEVNPSSQGLSESSGSSELAVTKSGGLPSLQQFMQQPTVKRLMPGVALLLGVLFVLIFWVSMSATPYKSVSDGMQSEDVQLAFEALQSSNYKVKINESTGRLEVPVDQYQSARIYLASQGLPRAASSGGMGSLSENSSMTTSQFMEQVKYNAALENELARTIAEISTIDTVRVHLAAPKQSVFVRDRQPAKASVVVKPYRGRVVDAGQVQSIVHLVSSSVPYLALEDVTVVDNVGNLLTASNKDSAAPALSNARFETDREMELTSRIYDLLTPALGGGNVRTVVNLEMDFTQRESTFEQYFDADEGAPEIRSEVITSDTQTGIAASGVPGGTTNVPPDQAEVVPEGEVPEDPVNTSTATNEREQTTRNYELDKEIRFVKEQIGRVTAMTAGVIVDESALKDLATRRYRSVNGLEGSFDQEGTELSFNDEGSTPEATSGESEIPAELLATLMEAELDRFRSLVLSALPYDATRGDSVTISTAPFFVDPPQEYQLPWHQDPAILEWGRHGMTSLGLIAFFLIVVAPVLRAYLPSKDDDVEALLAEQLADGELSAEDRQALEDGEALDEIKAKLKPKKSAISADMLDTANSYDDKVAIVRLLVAEDAGRVANVLKKMIKPA